MENKSIKIKNDLNRIKETIIFSIIECLTEARTIEIELDNPIIYNNDIIISVNIERSVIIVGSDGNNGSDYDVNLSDLSIEFLLPILEMIEEEEYEIFELFDEEV